MTDQTNQLLMKDDISFNANQKPETNQQTIGYVHHPSGNQHSLFGAQQAEKAKYIVLD